MAYVPEAKFKEHIANHADDPKVCVLVNLHMIFAQIINTCESQHDALVRANT